MATEQRISKIAKCIFTKPWQPPQGAMLYYHELIMENGDIGTVGKTSQNPPDIAAGVEIEYSLEPHPNGGNKMKIIRAVSSNVQSTTTQSTGSPNPSPRQPYQKAAPKQVQISDYYGYIAGYTKDLVIAGKTTKKDIDAFKKIFDELVDHVDETIKKNNTPTPAQ